MARTRSLTTPFRTALLALAALAGAASGQTMTQPGVTVHDERGPLSDGAVPPSWVIAEMADQDSEAVRVYRQRQAELRKVERELRRLNAMYFRTRHEETRQIGMYRLREYTDPVSFPAMLEVFEDSGEDVRGAVLDHLASLEDADADTTLAWAAVFGADEGWRADARDRLVSRVDATGEVTEAMKFIVAGALLKNNEQEIVSGAEVADLLNIYEVIPHLINAQVGGGSSEAVEGNGALAFIVIGKQISFVSDLTPIVADSAVAFDPQLSVVTEGVILRVDDAVVVTYLPQVSRVLNRLGSSLTGQRTDGMGYDLAAWWKWHDEVYLPKMAERQGA
jgi:hypothetical protein